MLEGAAWPYEENAQEIVLALSTLSSFKIFQAKFKWSFKVLSKDANEIILSNVRNTFRILMLS